MSRGSRAELGLYLHAQLRGRDQPGDGQEPAGVDRAPNAWTSTPSGAGRRRRAEGYENGAATFAGQRECLVADLVPGPVEQHVKSRRGLTEQLFDEGGVVVVNGYFGAEVADMVAVGGAGNSDDPGSCAPRASWTAALPTPLDAAVTSTVPPDFSLARSTRPS